MTRQTIVLEVDTPDVVVMARVLEVGCGDSYVTIRQVMGPSDNDWTVYKGRGREQGLVGKVDNAPYAPNPSELIDWASDLVTRMEHASLARAALGQQLDDKPHPEKG